LHGLLSSGSTANGLEAEQMKVAYNIAVPGGGMLTKDGINFAGWTDSMAGAVNAVSANHRLSQGHLERLGI